VHRPNFGDLHYLDLRRSGLFNKRTVTGRLLPRRFRLDASDEFLVIDEGFEEVVPFVSGAASMDKHLLQLFNSVAGKRSEVIA
jgi:hypothetical protein